MDVVDDRDIYGLSNPLLRFNSDRIKDEDRAILVGTKVEEKPKQQYVIRYAAVDPKETPEYKAKMTMDSMMGIKRTE